MIGIFQLHFFCNPAPENNKNLLSNQLLIFKILHTIKQSVLFIDASCKIVMQRPNDLISSKLFIVKLFMSEWSAIIINFIVVVFSRAIYLCLLLSVSVQWDYIQIKVICDYCKHMMKYMIETKSHEQKIKLVFYWPMLVP